MQSQSTVLVHLRSFRCPPNDPKKLTEERFVQVFGLVVLLSLATVKAFW